MDHNVSRLARSNKVSLSNVKIFQEHSGQAASDMTPKAQRKYLSEKGQTEKRCNVLRNKGFNWCARALVCLCCVLCVCVCVFSFFCRESNVLRVRAFGVPGFLREFAKQLKTREGSCVKVVKTPLLAIDSAFVR